MLAVQAALSGSSTLGQFQALFLCPSESSEF